MFGLESGQKPKAGLSRRRFLVGVGEVFAGAAVAGAGILSNPGSVAAGAPLPTDSSASRPPEAAVIPDVAPPDLQKIVTDKMLSHYEFVKEYKQPLTAFNHRAETVVALQEYLMATMGNDVAADKLREALNNSFNAYFYALDRIRTTLIEKLGLNHVLFMPDTIRVTTQTGNRRNNPDIVIEVPVMTILGLDYETLSHQSPDNTGEIRDFDGIAWAYPLISLGPNGEVLFVDAERNGIADAIFEMYQQSLPSAFSVPGVSETIIGFAAVAEKMRNDGHDVWGFDDGMVTEGLRKDGLSMTKTIPGPYYVTHNYPAGYRGTRMGQSAGHLPTLNLMQEATSN